MAAVLGLGIIIGCICGLVVPSAAATDDDAPVMVGEIYNNPTNVQKLYNALAGNGTTYDKIKTLAGQTQNAADFRACNNDREIMVTFGGWEWYATYLSTTKDGRPILTLWLAYPFTTAKWNNVIGNSDEALSKYYVYPLDLYSTSYVRTMVLNNAGDYSTDDGKTLSNTVTPNADHTMAKFSVDGVTNSVTDVIVKPINVEWQRAGQLAGIHDGSPNRKNENWGEEPADNWETVLWGTIADPYLNDYSRIPALENLYGAWKDDYLWLPSVSELANYWGYTTGNYNTVPYWTRSGTRNYHGFVGVHAYYVEQNEVYREREIRPALHIDLSANELYAHSWSEWETIELTADNRRVERRTCSACGDTEKRIISFGTYCHQIILEHKNGFEEAVIKVTVYTDQAAPFNTPQNLLNYLNSSVDCDYLNCEGCLRYYDPSANRFKDGGTIERLCRSVNNTFMYWYTKLNGDKIPRLPALSDLSITDTVK